MRILRRRTMSVYWTLVLIRWPDEGIADTLAHTPDGEGPLEPLAALTMNPQGGHGDVPMTVRAMKAGAAEFLPKPFRDNVLLGAIRQAIKRSRVALHNHSEMLALRTAYDSLTPREGQVVALVVSGLLNKQIGGELGISEITVKAHRGQVMRKMKADSLPDLVTMAARLGLKAPPKH
jgi:FixJ family two-component response regulator